jgi:hypothetical protein
MKTCGYCGNVFWRNKKQAYWQWEKAAFCSPLCRNKGRATHKRTRTRLYRIWASIKQRCLNPHDQSFPDYGGRGITICDEWRDDFLAFANYVEPDPGAREIGRIDNELGYQPGNIRWETRRQNTRNTRNTHWVEYQGRRLSLAEVCEGTSLSSSAVGWRLRHGWNVERALQP